MGGMNKQDKLQEAINLMISQLRVMEYSGGLKINFTNGCISNNIKKDITEKILDLNKDIE